MKKQKLIIMQYLILSLFIILNSCNKDPKIENESVVEIGQLIIVIKDSIPLRIEPNNQAEIAKYVRTSLQLKVLEISQDKKWYKVKIGEDKGYQLNHSEEYWIFHQDVFQQPEKVFAKVSLDVSVFENEDLQNAMRIDHSDYLNKLNSLTFDTRYYVGSTYSNISPTTTCSNPISICAQIYKPDHYFLFENAVKYTDATTFEELKNRYKQLYENGTTTPFYEIKSDLDIEIINEKLICAKTVMTKPGCYPEEYIGTEVEVLNSHDYTVNDNHFLSFFPIDSKYLFQTKLKGGVQNLNFLYILEVKYSNKQTETIVKRIALWWPLCM